MNDRQQEDYGLYVERWKRTGLELERIRREELRALDTRANGAAIDALAEIGLCFGRPRENSGLVEMQKWFMTFARMQRLLPLEVHESAARSLAGPSPKGVTKGP